MRDAVEPAVQSYLEALQAEADGADYIGVGPTFPSSTKCFTEFTGPELLSEISNQVSLPSFAIGGVTLENVSQVVDAGFFRVAVSNAIHSDETGEAASEFLKILRSAREAMSGL